MKYAYRYYMKWLKEDETDFNPNQYFNYHLKESKSIKTARRYTELMIKELAEGAAYGEYHYLMEKWTEEWTEKGEG